MRFIVEIPDGARVEYTFPSSESIDLAFARMKRENPEWVSISHPRYPIE